MDVSHYNVQKTVNGAVITKVIHDYVRLYNCKNILFIRTPTTGNWLDNLFINNTNVVRILYDTHFITGINSSNIKNKIEYKDLEEELRRLDKKYDLICIDPFHTYEISKSNLDVLYSYLTEDGTLISHDCFPSMTSLARPTYCKNNAWCGETYVALVEFAYHHPELFYGILNTDTGIGIISKTNNIPFLTNTLDVGKQKILLEKHKNENFIQTYTYFLENATKIINAIHFQKK